jgi:predicted membrane channel-forming protein YqfA (hemolysin III family)
MAEDRGSAGRSRAPRIAPLLNVLLCGLFGIGILVFGIVDSEPFAFVVFLVFVVIEVIFIRQILRERREMTDTSE